MKKVKYPFVMRPLSKPEGGGYLVEFPDLPGCMADGATPEEAVQSGVEAMEEWLHAAKKLGRAIPKPSSAGKEEYSGKILQRFPKTIHARLAHRAKEEGVSLNQLILAMVSEGLGIREVHFNR